jgi:hypothetical protein
MKKDILQLAQDYVKNLFDKKVDDRYTYHSYQHSINVLKAAERLGIEANLDDESILQLQLAALFHDSGFTDGPVNHERRGAAIARKFLETHDVDEEDINQVCRLVKATEKGWLPNDELEEIIRDADLSNLAEPLYLIESQALRDEWAFLSDEEMDDKTWHTMNYDFIKNHEYHSEAAQNLYNKAKKKNLKSVKKKLKELDVPALSISTSKSAQTQFKTALRNHIDLSSIADNKANIMLSVNALIITVALPVIANMAGENRVLIAPAVLLLIVCVTSMIYATLATRPIKMSGYSTLEDIKAKKSNLFFFGNFYKMPFDEYAEGINLVLADEKNLDNSITRDLFFLGKSLGAKYNRLRLCYSIFMYGIIVVVLAFCISFLLT